VGPRPFTFAGDGGGEQPGAGPGVRSWGGRGHRGGAGGQAVAGAAGTDTSQTSGGTGQSQINMPGVSSEVFHSLKIINIRLLSEIKSGV